MSKSYLHRHHPPARQASELLELIVDMSVLMAGRAAQAYRIARQTRSPCPGGRTLRPGDHTPLWNELRRQLKPHLKKYGAQARLGRLLGLPRQRVNAFVTGGGEMPDAERALQLLAWLMAVRQNRPPG